MTALDFITVANQGINRVLQPLYERIPEGVAETIETTTMSGIESLIERMAGVTRKEAMAGSYHTHYLEAGEAGNQPLLFLHGFSLNKHNFAGIVNHFSNDFHVILPDLPAFGENRPDESLTYSLEYYADWLDEFCKAEGLSGVHLVGNSLGADVALMYAYRHQKNLRSLTAIAPGGVVGDEPTGVHAELADGNNVFIVSGIDEFEYLMGRATYTGAPIPLVLKNHLFKKAKRNAAWYRKVLEDVAGGSLDEAGDLDPNITEEELSAIKVPTLLLWGREDDLFPLPIAHFMDKHMPNTELHIIDECGHIPHLEEPTLTKNRIYEFIRSH